MCIRDSYRAETKTPSEQWCKVPYYESRAADVMQQRDKSLASLQRVLSGDCRHKPGEKGMMLAMTRTRMAALMVLQSQKEEAAKLLEDFHKEWQQADSELVPMKRAMSLEKYRKQAR